MDNYDDDFSNQPIPPRLTPSPTNADGSDESVTDTAPPARRSIYASRLHPGKYGVTITNYDTDWPTQFEAIRDHLRQVFSTSTPPAMYQAIEHIGSTAIPNMCAKPNVDVLVTLPSALELNHAIEALNWEKPTAPPFKRYTQCPNGGGIQGRESFKLYLNEYDPYYLQTPERSVYLINTDGKENHAGTVQERCYRTVRDVLRDGANADLCGEYADLKWKLSEEVFENSLVYSSRKDTVVRKILRRGGWTEEEVDEKEELGRRVWNVEDEEAY